MKALSLQHDLNFSRRRFPDRSLNGSYFLGMFLRYEIKHKAIKRTDLIIKGDRSFTYRNFLRQVTDSDL